MSKYTHDQGFLQDNKTGDYIREIIVMERCRAFGPLEQHKILLTADRQVRVWDGTAGHFTTCHRLSRRTQARIYRKYIG